VLEFLTGLAGTMMLRLGVFFLTPLSIILIFPEYFFEEKNKIFTNPIEFGKPYFGLAP
jgi:hypothetical protein